MNKSSQKKTNRRYPAGYVTSSMVISDKYIDYVKPVTKQWMSLAKVNKFKGMARNVEEVLPEIIPGYKIRG